MLAITWTRAVISCRVNCCRWPVSKKSGFNITINRRCLVAAEDPATCEFYFYNIDIGDLPTPICRCSSRLQCRRFSMSNVYIGRTLTYLLCCANVHPHLIHPNPHPNGILIGSAVFTQLTARLSLYFTLGHSFSLKIPLSHWGSRPHLIRGSLSPPEFMHQTTA